MELLEKTESAQELQDQQLEAKSKKPKKRVIINIKYTQYEIIKHIARSVFKWKCSIADEEEDWDILWTDCAVMPERLCKMKPYQKINHFPEMYKIAKKNQLAKNIKSMQKLYPNKYRFTPPTWILPVEYLDFKNQLNGNKTYIIKPPDLNQGKGIYLIKKIEDLQIQSDQQLIAQRYLHKPLLMEGLKFDLRIYALIAGCDPLRIYVHEEGLCRLATEEYQPPNQSNLSNQFMHLTNYAINKESKKFEYNYNEEEDDIGHKRSLQATWRYLKDQGHNIEKIQKKINRIIIKTLCTIQPSLAHVYKTCQPDDNSNSMCFEILGFDIFLDHRAKPWLLEVNHSPSFVTDTPLDKKVKKAVISDTLRIMNIQYKNRLQYQSKKQEAINKRKFQQISRQKRQEDKEDDVKLCQQLRDEYEKQNRGQFVKIYPDEDSIKYDCYLKSAKEIWQEWTGAKVNRTRRDQILQKHLQQEKAAFIQQQQKKKLINKNNLLQPLSQQINKLNLSEDCQNLNDVGSENSTAISKAKEQNSDLNNSYTEAYKFVLDPESSKTQTRLFYDHQSSMFNQLTCHTQQCPLNPLKSNSPYIFGSYLNTYNSSLQQPQTLIPSTSPQILNIKNKMQLLKPQVQQLQAKVLSVNQIVDANSNKYCGFILGNKSTVQQIKSRKEYLAYYKQIQLNTQENQIQKKKNILNILKNEPELLQLYQQKQRNQSFTTKVYAPSSTTTTPDSYKAYSQIKQIAQGSIFMNLQQGQTEVNSNQENINHTKFLKSLENKYSRRSKIHSKNIRSTGYYF